MVYAPARSRNLVQTGAIGGLAVLLVLLMVATGLT
jgi:hypothetical protein